MTKIYVKSMYTAVLVSCKNGEIEHGRQKATTPLTKEHLVLFAYLKKIMS
jgi:hypothetical protein